MKFTIQGIPPKKDRPRFTKRGTTYSTAGTKEGEQRVKLSFLSAFGKTKPLESAVSVKINACYSMPKSWSKKKKSAMLQAYKTTKPDADNVIKAILDGLNGLAYNDDNQVAIVSCVKLYSDSDFVNVEINEL